uniref:Uncharacterized protein n=1 Tax=Pipistrellus kuhlii TaxID=59472 RepID=A0A7J7TVZ8_PIPKU|nr:hypothetical protein mPipKuh1_009248 [Pipistrellus kuhlii]
MYFIDFFNKEEGRDRELETSMREKHRPAASCTPPTGDVPATKVHALDRNRTRDLSVRRSTLYPLSQTGFGKNMFLLILGKKGKVGGRKGDIDVREKHCTLPTRDQTPHLACALTRNGTGDVLVHRMMLI